MNPRRQVPAQIDPTMSVDEALRRYRIAFQAASTGRMHWAGGLLRVEGGTAYVDAFEQLQASRAREGRPWTPGEP